MQEDNRRRQHSRTQLYYAKTGKYDSVQAALRLRPQRIGLPEAQTAAVNGKPVIRGNSFAFGTAPVPFAVLPILVAARAFSGFDCRKGQQYFWRVQPLSVVLPSHGFLWKSLSAGGGAGKFKIKGAKEFVV